MKDFKLKSFDGTDIHVTIWDDVISPKAVLQVAHGMSEYAGRYDRFARYMNSKGYIVFADDHRGHGRTESDERRGHHQGNMFKKTLHDLVFFREWLKKEYSLPVFFLGHSYGSFLGQAFAQAGTDVKAIALLGTAQMHFLASLGSIVIAPVWLVARGWRPKFVNKASDLMFRYKGDKGASQWLTKDLERRQDFIDDPLCGVNMSINFDWRMLNETKKLYGKKAMAKLNTATAIALFCGDADPIGKNGKSSTKLYEMYKKNGIKTEMHMYETHRHEILNEVGAEKVYKDISDWFDKFIIYAQIGIDELGAEKE